ncbi:hypothetical protein [Nostoc sp.]|uniref:hypothetical protein n=1 Tax=Nostoc sp. TaxID=1180 RepID=UPI002FFCCF0B
MDKKIDINAEISQIRVVAILIFIFTLGLMPKRIWKLSVDWWYCQSTVGERIDGRGRNLFKDFDEYAAFMTRLEAQNGGRFPVVDNFWFTFIGRIVIWFILFIIVKTIIDFIK